MNEGPVKMSEAAAKTHQICRAAGKVAREAIAAYFEALRNRNGAIYNREAPYPVRVFFNGDVGYEVTRVVHSASQEEQEAAAVVLDELRAANAAAGIDE